MKKSLIAVLVVALVVILVAPFGLSFVADKRFIGLLDKLSESGMLDYTVLRTERGWFSTEMDVVMEISGDLAEAYSNSRVQAGKPVAANPGVMLKNRLYHGPVAIASFADMGASFSPVVSRVNTLVFVDEVDGDKANELLPIDIETLFKLAGGGQSKLSMENWTGDIADGEAQLQWDGISGQLVFNNGYTRTAIDLSAPLLSINAEDGAVKIENMAFETDTYVGSHELELGDASATISKVSIQASGDKGKKSVTIDGMSMEAGSTASGESSELVNSTVTMKIDGFNIEGVKYGPAVMSLDLNNLDAASIAKIQKQLKELQKTDMPEEQLSMMAASTMFSVLPDLLKKAPELIIRDISLESPFGKLNVVGSIRVDASNELAMANPFLLVEAIIADLNLNMPESLLVELQKLEVRKELEAESLEHTPEMIEEMAKSRVTMKMSPLVAQGMLVFADSEYTMNVTFESGKLVLNGQEIPVAALMSGMQGGQ